MEFSRWSFTPHGSRVWGLDLLHTPLVLLFPLGWAPVELRPLLSLHLPSIGLIVSQWGPEGLMLQGKNTAGTEEEERRGFITSGTKGHGPQSGWKRMPCIYLGSVVRPTRFSVAQQNPLPLHPRLTTTHQKFLVATSLQTEESPQWIPWIPSWIPAEILSQL